MTPQQIATNTRGAALVRAAMNGTGRSLESLAAAVQDAAAVRDAYMEALTNAVTETRGAEAVGARESLDAGARVIAATNQLRAAQARVNALSAEYQAVRRSLL